MRVDFVVPRYGTEVVGGAEFAVRMLAEELVRQRGWAVQVLTTTARDSRTWAAGYPDGSTTIGGVPVRRFALDSGRDPDFDAFSTELLVAPSSASPDREREWLRRQGPNSTELLDAVSASEADVVVFTPYLYAPTVEGIGRVGRRAVLQPATHDEQPLRLPMFEAVFGAATGLAFYTDAERRFTESRFAIGHRRQVVVGLGSDAGPGDPAEARAAVGVGDRPFLLCLGRVDDGKGTGALVRFFTEYQRRHGGDLALVLAGPVVHHPADHPDVIVAGPVSESVKWGLLRAAEVLVSPSAYESFALVLIEAWNVRTPVLVNARCAVTVEHCRRANGGIWYSGFASFEAALRRLLASEDLRASLANSGARYVQERYQWPAIIDRYAGFLDAVADDARGGASVTT